MIQKIGLLAAVVMALNFLAVMGALGFLVVTGKLTQETGAEISNILFPQPEPATMPATQPVDDPATTQPVLRLERLLERQSGKPAGEQVESIRAAFDAQVAQLDRQRRELGDLKRQLDSAQSQFVKDKAVLEAREKTIAEREKQQLAQQDDKGFNASLEVYNAMQAKQVKEIFKSLDDSTVVRYLQAMDSRRASKIFKEFKTPEELNRAQLLLEKVRMNGVPLESAPSSPSPVAANASAGS